MVSWRRKVVEVMSVLVVVGFIKLDIFLRFELDYPVVVNGDAMQWSLEF